MESEGSRRQSAGLTNRNRIEACKLDEKAYIFKVRNLYGELERRCGGHKREGESAIPGEIFEELDSWLRRKLRCVIWRQWKRVFARAKGLMRRGLERDRALKSAMNGRGPWWNAGASHMNEAFPKSYFDRCGLLSLLNQRLKSQRTS